MPNALPNLENRIQGLSQNALFKGLPDETLRLLAREAVLRTYENGAPLFFQDAEADGFYLVLRGKAKVFRIGTDGREQILHLFGRGECIGEVATFEGANFPANAAAIGDVETLHIPRETFLKIGRSHPEILLQMLAILSRRLRRFVDLVDDLSLKEISARLAKYLLDLHARSKSNVVEIETAKTLLAARLGTVAETLSRTLAKMQKHEIIAVEGRQVRLLKLDALLDIAAGLPLR
jgi:CRP-like cAMP-binding protein